MLGTAPPLPPHAPFTPGAASHRPLPVPLPPRPLLLSPQAAQARRDELSASLNRIADLGEDLTKLRTQFELVAKQNAEAEVRLVVSLKRHERPVLLGFPRFGCGGADGVHAARARGAAAALWMQACLGGWPHAPCLDRLPCCLEPTLSSPYLINPARMRRMWAR